MRAVIRIVLPKTTDEEALEIKKAVRKVVAQIKDAEVEMNTFER